MRRESVFFRSQIIAHGFLIIVAVLIDSPIVIVNQKLHRIRTNPVVVIPVCNTYQRIIIGVHKFLSSAAEYKRAYFARVLRRRIRSGSIFSIMRNELSGSMRNNLVAIDNSCSTCLLLPQLNRRKPVKKDNKYFIIVKSNHKNTYIF